MLRPIILLLFFIFDFVDLSAQWTTPVTNWSTPVQLSTPVKNWTKKVKKWSTPVQLSTPIQNPTRKIEDWSTPVKDPTRPVELSTPIQNPTRKIEDWSTPVKDPTRPVELSTPIQNPTRKIEDWSTPVKDPTRTVELSTPIQNPTRKIEDWSTPVKDPTRTVELSTPIQNPTKKIEDWSTPVKDPTKPVELSTPVNNAFRPGELSTPIQNPTRQINDWSTPVKDPSRTVELSTSVKEPTRPVQLSKPVELSSPVVLSNPVEVGKQIELSKPIILSTFITLSKPSIPSKNSGFELENPIINQDNLSGLINTTKKIAEGRWVGTGYVQDANNWYLQQYLNSINSGNKNNSYLIGYGFTSLWTPETYQKTLTAFTLVESLPKLGYNSIKPGLNVIEETRGFFKEATYNDKVLKQMNNMYDESHSFPQSVDSYASMFGTWSAKMGGDGKIYQWLKMDGTYAGKNGIFEFTKNEEGIITHRFFRAY